MFAYAHARAPARDERRKLRRGLFGADAVYHGKDRRVRVCLVVAIGLGAALWRHFGTLA
jgi:hypothetical protein